jgi:hypothetical protein
MKKIGWVRFSVIFYPKAKLSYYAMQTSRGEEYSSCSFLTSELDENEWTASRPGSASPSGKDPFSNWMVWTQKL